MLVPGVDVNGFTGDGNGNDANGVALWSLNSKDKQDYIPNYDYDTIQKAREIEFSSHNDDIDESIDVLNENKLEDLISNYNLDDLLKNYKLEDYGNEYSNDKVWTYLMNKQLAEDERSWQKEMSDTSYSRAMADLKSAGINPVLAVSGLTGASTGSVSPGYQSTNEYSTMDYKISKGNNAVKLLIALFNGISSLASVALA